MFDYIRSIVQAKHFAGGYQKRKRPQQSPKPTQFDQVLVEEGVAVGKVNFWELDVIADNGSDQQDQIDEHPFVRREKQILSAPVYEHCQEYVGHRDGVPDQQRAFGFRSHAQIGRLIVIRLDRSGPRTPFGDHFFFRTNWKRKTEKKRTFKVPNRKRPKQKFVINFCRFKRHMVRFVVLEITLNASHSDNGNYATTTAILLHGTFTVIFRSPSLRINYSCLTRIRHSSHVLITNRTAVGWLFFFYLITDFSFCFFLDRLGPRSLDPGHR